MKTQRVYVVTRNSDLTEGRGHRVVECFCATEATANRLSQGIDVQGTDGGVNGITLYQPETEDRLWKNWWYGPVWVIPPTEEDRDMQATLDVRARRASATAKALAKAKELGLTDEEIAALQNPEVLG